MLNILFVIKKYYIFITIYLFSGRYHGET